MRIGEVDWRSCDAILVRMWNAGHSTRLIAAAINREVDPLLRNNVDVTRDSVIGRAHRLALPTHPTRRTTEARSKAG